MQLLLLKQGGQEIYVGPLGHNCTNLINHFEVGRIYIYIYIYIDNEKYGIDFNFMLQIIIFFITFQNVYTCLEGNPRC